MSDHNTCGACRWKYPSEIRDCVYCPKAARWSGRETRHKNARACSQWTEHQALESEVEQLRAQRDALLEACEIQQSACPRCGGDEDGFTGAVMHYKGLGFPETCKLCEVLREAIAKAKGGVA